MLISIVPSNIFYVTKLVKIYITDYITAFIPKYARSKCGYFLYKSEIRFRKCRDPPWSVWKFSNWLEVN
jgi:hypothetical protein